MRVMTYNVHGWMAPDGTANVERIRSVIESTGADVVGLNEVFHPGETNPPLALLAGALGFHYAFGATQAADTATHPPYGNALLSRWPIIAHAAHHLGPQLEYGRRGLLEARLLLPQGQTFTMYVTHLDHRREAHRIEQWANATAWLKRDRRRPHLVLGDLNALSWVDYPDSESLEALNRYQALRGWPLAAFDLLEQTARAGYIDCQVAGLSAPGPTYPAAEPERRIDYILMPGFLAGRFRSCAPVRTPDTVVASDHLPVLAELALS